MGCEFVGWIQLPQDWFKWRAVANIRVPKKGEEFIDLLNDYQRLKKDSRHGVPALVT
jgi:hypothetical protein